MSAIKKITDEIIRSAGIRANEILDAAKNTVNAASEKMRSDCEQWQRSYDDAFEMECSEMAVKAESENRRNRRRALLDARNLAIVEVIAEARVKISSLPQGEYFDFLACLYEKNSQAADGVLRLSSADYKRMPEDFALRLRRIHPDYTLEICEGLEKSSGGFVLSYGNIIHNCILDDIFESEAQLLKDRVYEALTTEMP